MLTLRHILFPTDFSACAKAAFRHAVFLARRHGALLHMLHVTETGGRLPDEAPEAVAAQLEALQAEAPAGVPIRLERLRRASPALGILEYADDHGVELIVMGTHGRRGLQRLLTGSVAEEVVRLATCPVLTVNAQRAVPPRQAVRRILVPTDFSTRSEQAFQLARSLARDYGATLHLLHVIEEVILPSIYGLEPVPVTTPDVVGRTQNALEAMAQTAIDRGVPTVPTVLVGHAAHDILAYAQEADADLIVLATHGRAGLEHLLLGSVAEKVVRLATCPVCTIKPPLLPRSLAPAATTSAALA